MLKKCLFVQPSKPLEISSEIFTACRVFNSLISFLEMSMKLFLVLPMFAIRPLGDYWTNMARRMLGLSKTDFFLVFSLYGFTTCIYFTVLFFLSVRKRTG